MQADERFDCNVDDASVLTLAWLLANIGRLLDRAARAEAAEKRAERLRQSLRAAVIARLPNGRRRCDECESEWGGDDAETHGTRCLLAIDAAREGK